jgi:hypothetical protein
VLFKNIKIRIYKTKTLPVFLNGSKTLNALRDKHRLKVTEHRVLKNMFGPKMKEVTTGWRKLHNEELHNL